MSRYLDRIVLALIIILAGVAVTSMILVHISPRFEIISAKITLPHTRTRSEEILRVLIPNGDWGEASQLHRFERSEEIQVLKEAQVEAHDERALAIAFLLAVLGHDYKLNRGRLLEALNQCARKPYPDYASCSDVLADYIRALVWRGDASLLDPLFVLLKTSDGGLSESLGTYFSELLWRRPRQFVGALRSRTKKEQRAICSMAESADGSGIELRMLRDMRRSLKHMSAQSNSGLARVARNCLIGVEAGHLLTVEYEKSLVR